MMQAGPSSSSSSSDGPSFGQYKVGKTIGKGNFAIVKQATHELANMKVAIKIVDRRVLDAEATAKLIREIAILKRIEHPHVVHLYEVLQSETHTYMITQFVPNGELFNRLIVNGKYAEPDARRIFRQLTSAVAYCHANQIVHRDLKSENILLDENDNVILIDFGFSRCAGKSDLLNTWCGSPPYAAPELHMAQPYDGTKADAWSLGVMLYIIVTGGFPFPGDSVTTLKRHILQNAFGIPWWVSVECADLIRKMLVVAPDKRYSIQQITQHKWFTRGASLKEQQLIAMSLAGENIDVTFYAQCEDLTNLRILRQRTTSGDDMSINPTIVHFMQSEGIATKQHVIHSIKHRTFDSNHGTYQMLYDKLRSGVGDMRALLPGKALLTSSSSSCLLPTRSPPRRGSITTGIAAPSPVDPSTMISVTELAKLQFAAGREARTDEESGNPEDKPKHARFTVNVYDDNSGTTTTSEFDRRILSNRRHTLGPLSLIPPIGVPPPHVIVNAAPAMTLAPPPQMQQHQQPQVPAATVAGAIFGLGAPILPPHLLMGMGSGTSAQHHMMDTSQGHLANAATPYPLQLYNNTLITTPINLMSQVDQLNSLYAQALTAGNDAWGNNLLSPNYGAHSSVRRASDGSVALAAQTLHYLNSIAAEHLSNEAIDALNSTTSQLHSPTSATIEEQGANYLSRPTNRKRRTTLDTLYNQGQMAQHQQPQAVPFAPQPPQQLLLEQQVQLQQPRRRRHIGGSITQGTSTSSRRASSPLQHISQHDLGMLHSLHKQAVSKQKSTGESTSVNNLQQEFEDMHATNNNGEGFANGPSVLQLSPGSAVGRICAETNTPHRVQSPTPQLHMIAEQVDMPMDVASAAAAAAGGSAGMDGFYTATPNAPAIIADTVISMLTVDDLSEKVKSVMNAIGLGLNYENSCQLGNCISFVAEGVLIDVIVHGDMIGQSRFDIVNVVTVSIASKERLIRDVIEAMRRTSPPLASCARQSPPTAAVSSTQSCSPSPVQP